MTNQQQQKWIYAAALACLWASSEIIIGSFLHNLKVPMRGTILAGVAVVIMTSIGYRFRLKGIFWRAGLLTAAMKTLSPSAVLLGPMLAISIQGLFMEMVISSLGTRRLVFILGGALSITWNFIHLILGYWVYYGNDVVALGSRIVSYVRQETGWQFISGTGLVIIFASLYASAGALAAVIGTSLGQRRSTTGIRIPRREKKQNTATRQQPSLSIQRSLFWLALLPMLVAGNLLMLAYFPLTLAVFAWLASVSLLLIRYRNSYRRMAKPGFWIVFISLTVLSSLLLGPTIEEGLIIGLRMNLRAILFVFVFSALGFELRNEKLATLFNRRNKYFLSVLETCFETLPLVISILPPVRSVLRHPRQTLFLFSGTFIMWTESLRLRNQQPIPALLISGEKGSGKSYMLENKIVTGLNDRKLSFSGILMNYRFSGGEHIGYSISLLPEGHELTLLEKNHPNADLYIGSYGFLQQTFDEGTNHVVKRLPDSQLFILDEPGWLELYGFGWYELLKHARENNRPWIVVVRDELSEDFIQFWNLHPVHRIRSKAGDTEIHQALQFVEEAVYAGKS